MCVDTRLVADKLHHIAALFLWLLYCFWFNVLKGVYCTVTDNRESCHVCGFGMVVITPWFEASL